VTAAGWVVLCAGAALAVLWLALDRWQRRHPRPDTTRGGPT
jgi:hypothetical protein